MPLASSVDKNWRTETTPFIEVLSYGHNYFWHSHLVVHAKPTYNRSFHTATHYGYPYTLSKLNSISTELHFTRCSFLRQHPCSSLVCACIYGKPPELCVPSFFLLGQPLEDCSSPPRAGFHNHGHVQPLPIWSNVPGEWRHGALFHEHGGLAVSLPHTRHCRSCR